MEGNLCDVNHLDSNARLPPRKRLLVGLKNNQNAAYGSRHLSSSETASESTFRLSGGFDLLIDKWMGSQENIDNRSAEEIIEASKLAVKFAVSARSKAETKAALAAKAIHVAKEALEFSATIAEEFARRERSLVVKKNKRKMKLKKKKQVIQSVRILGRKPRQTKNSSSHQQNVNQSSSNIPKGNVRNKRLKVKQAPENPDPDPSDELKSDGSSEETHSLNGSDHENPSKSIRIDDSGAETSLQRKKSATTTGVKKSRFKQKNCPY